MAPPVKLAEKLKVMGNWPLPDTPRCAEMHLAELALQEDIAQRQRDEASRLEKLKEEKARADAEFREMRRAAAKAAGLPITARDAVGPFSGLVGRLRLGLGFRAFIVRQSTFFEAVLTSQERRCYRSAQIKVSAHWLIYAQVAAPPPTRRRRSRCRSPSCRPHMNRCK